MDQVLDVWACQLRSLTRPRLAVCFFSLRSAVASLPARLWGRNVWSPEQVSCGHHSFCR
jgi:hypothetical protein